MESRVLVLAQEEVAAGIGGALFFVFYLAIIVLFIAGMWSTFAKAGQPGWGRLIPILNVYFLLKITGKPGWWLLLYLIPIVNIIVTIIVSIDIAKNFGYGVGFGLGLAFLGPIFFLILGFGSAQYQRA